MHCYDNWSSAAHLIDELNIQKIMTHFLLYMHGMTILAPEFLTRKSTTSENLCVKSLNLTSAAV